MGILHKSSHLMFIFSATVQWSIQDGCWDTTGVPQTAVPWVWRTHRKEVMWSSGVHYYVHRVVSHAMMCGVDDWLFVCQFLTMCNVLKQQSSCRSSHLQSMTLECATGLESPGAGSQRFKKLWDISFYVFWSYIVSKYFGKLATVHVLFGNAFCKVLRRVHIHYVPSSAARTACRIGFQWFSCGFMIGVPCTQSVVLQDVSRKLVAQAANSC